MLEAIASDRVVWTHHRCNLFSKKPPTTSPPERLVTHVIGALAYMD
jgi:hypothetical protein